MSEEKKTLKDEELSNVAGGGNGNVPQGGITFTLHGGDIKEGYYYSKEENLNEVAYVYFGTYTTKLLFIYEKFTVNPDGTWESHNTVPYGFDVDEQFKNDYKYRLNVKA